MPYKKSVSPKDSSVPKSVDEIIGKPDVAKTVKEEPVAEPVVPLAPSAPIPAPVQPFQPAQTPFVPHYQQQVTPTQEVSGILDIQPEGHGFLRPKFIPSQRDVYISQSQIRRFMLRPGDLIKGIGRPPKDTERYFKDSWRPGERSAKNPQKVQE